MKIRWGSPAVTRYIRLFALYWVIALATHAEGLYQPMHNDLSVRRLIIPAKTIRPLQRQNTARLLHRTPLSIPHHLPKFTLQTAQIAHEFIQPLRRIALRRRQRRTRDDKCCKYCCPSAFSHLQHRLY